MQTEEFHEALDELVALAAGSTTAVMCSEAVPPASSTSTPASVASRCEETTATGRCSCAWRLLMPTRGFVISASPAAAPPIRCHRSIRVAGETASSGIGG